MYVIDSNNLIKIRVSHSGLDYLVTDFVSVLICIYSFYHVLHVAARFFLKIVEMWVSPLVLDAILIIAYFGIAMMFVVINPHRAEIFCISHGDQKVIFILKSSYVLVGSFRFI